ncbi:MAG: hypothetical protein JWQ66_1692 [Mucilaginibacter sp.]|nr:hypothetical protein [Mucilaginibacter sp.]
MKKAFLTLVLVFIAYCSFAQWTTSGSNIYNSNTGNVGIGTTTPAQQLDIAGGFHTAGTSELGGGYFHVSTDQSFSSSANYTFRDGVGINNPNGSSFAIGTSVISIGAMANGVSLITTGNIGIGTTAPQSKLHIFQSAPDAVGLVIQGNTINTDRAQHYIALTFDGDYGNATGNYSQIRSYSNLYTNWGSQLAFYTSRYGVTNTLDERMRIDGSGNIGIGTTSPTAGLDVWNGAVHVVAGTGGNYAVDGAYIAWNTTNGVGGETNFVNNIGGGNAGGFTFDNTTRSNVVTRLMTILGNGNIGIGTTNPQGYKLAVNGTAIATAMTVKLYTNWPDYVFKPDFHLLPLNEVKTYIDQNQHLPDMPSEAEVTKNGINLGEMNTLLTKKVEELTLYLIEQEKIQKQQQDKILSQDDRIEKLEIAIEKLTKDK